MKKQLFVSFLFFVFCVPVIYGQQDDAEKREFLRKAPPRVQEYYRVFDSLANPTWTGMAHEKWSLGELKKYASLVYEANEYDPVQSGKNYLKNRSMNRTLKIQHATYEWYVIEEVRKKISEKHAALINNHYWLTVVVEDIVTAPYKPDIHKDGSIIEFKLKLRVKAVWKGLKYKVGDIATCYYLNFWRYGLVKKGGTYLVSLYTISEQEHGEAKNALGGPDDVQQSVFPIENGFVLDDDNLFKMGKEVEISRFLESLASTIKQIKSWSEPIQ